MSTFGNFINGSFVAASASQPNINPSDLSDIIGEYGVSAVSEVNSAVSSAKAAASGWANSTPQERFNVLDAIGTEILGRNIVVREADGWVLLA